MISVLALAACSGGGSAPQTEASPPEPAATSTTPATATNAGAAEEQPSLAEPEPASQEQPTRFPPERYADLEVVTLLPQDAIPAIDNPRFLSAADANAYYDPDELVMGVAFGDEARAYSVPFLSRHEIVNDTVSGVKIAVTW